MSRLSPAATAYHRRPWQPAVNRRALPVPPGPRCQDGSDQPLSWSGWTSSATTSVSGRVAARRPLAFCQYVSLPSSDSPNRSNSAITFCVAALIASRVRSSELPQLPGHLELDMAGNLVPRQGVQLPLRLTYRSPQVLGGGVGLADHLAAFAGRCLQPVGFAHGFPLARRLDRGCSQSRPV